VGSLTKKVVLAQVTVIGISFETVTPLASTTTRLKVCTRLVTFAPTVIVPWPVLVVTLSYTYLIVNGIVCDIRAGKGPANIPGHSDRRTLRHTGRGDCETVNCRSRCFNGDVDHFIRTVLLVIVCGERERERIVVINVLNVKRERAFGGLIRQGRFAEHEQVTRGVPNIPGDCDGPVEVEFISRLDCEGHNFRLEIGLRCTAHDIFDKALFRVAIVFMDPTCLIARCRLHLPLTEVPLRRLIAIDDAVRAFDHSEPIVGLEKCDAVRGRGFILVESRGGPIVEIQHTPWLADGQAVGCREGRFIEEAP